MKGSQPPSPSSSHYVTLEIVLHIRHNLYATSRDQVLHVRVQGTCPLLPCMLCKVLLHASGSLKGHHSLLCIVMHALNTCSTCDYNATCLDPTDKFYMNSLLKQSKSCSSYCQFCDPSLYLLRGLFSYVTDISKIHG